MAFKFCHVMQCCVNIAVEKVLLNILKVWESIISTITIELAPWLIQSMNYYRLSSNWILSASKSTCVQGWNLWQNYIYR